MRVFGLYAPGIVLLALAGIGSLGCNLGWLALLILAVSVIGHVRAEQRSYERRRP